jgi:hypothetical protein
MSTIFHYTKRRLSKCNGSWVVAIKQHVNFKCQPPAMFVFFVFRKKNSLIKSCSAFDYLSEYNISWSYVEWRKFCIHLRSLNVRHFGMVAATALKLWHRGHLQWHDLLLNFIKMYQLVHKFIGRQTRRQDDLISLQFSFRKEKKAKNTLTKVIHF